MDTITKLQNKLIGSLIGLIRATEGNESLITPQTNELLIKGLVLSTFDLNTTEDELNLILKNIENEKRRLIPNCFECMASCGRNEDYDMNELNNDSQENRNLKFTILLSLQKLASLIFKYNTIIPITTNTLNLIYRSLYMIGTKDYGVNEYLPIILNLTETQLTYLNITK